MFAVNHRLREQLTPARRGRRKTDLVFYDAGNGVEVPDVFRPPIGVPERMPAASVVAGLVGVRIRPACSEPQADAAALRMGSRLKRPHPVISHCEMLLDFGLSPRRDEFLS